MHKHAGKCNDIRSYFAVSDSALLTFREQGRPLQQAAHVEAEYAFQLGITLFLKTVLGIIRHILQQTWPSALHQL